MKICVEKLIKKSKKKKRGVEPQNRATTTTTTIQYLNTFGDCHPAKPLGKKIFKSRDFELDMASDR